MKRICFHLIIVFFFVAANTLFLFGAYAQADFTIPDTICVGAPLPITNTTVEGEQFFWSFDSLAIGPAVSVTVLPNLNNLYVTPGISDFVLDSGNYYLFSPEYYTHNLIRWDFGTNPLGNPIAAVNLGPILNSSASQCVQFIKENNNWYMFSIGGDLMRFDFGSSVTNTPTSISLGNPGNVMSWAHQCTIFKEGGNWYGFVANRTSGTIARFDFGSNLLNTSPTGTTITNSSTTPSTCNFALRKENNNWYMITTNLLDNSLSLLSFGTAINNDTPMVSGPVPSPDFDIVRGIVLLEDCGHLYGFIGNEQPSGNSCRIDFAAGITSSFTITSLGNFSNTVNFAGNFLPFWCNDTLRMMVSNGHVPNTTRWDVPTTLGSLVMTDTARTPTGIIYNIPGNYTVSLIVDEGRPHISSMCRNITVVNCSILSASFQSSTTLLCSETQSCINFFDHSIGNPTSWHWLFPGATPDTSSQQNPTNICYSSPGTYSVTLIVTNSLGSDTLTVPSMIIVGGTPAPPTITMIGDTLYSSHASSYQWYYNGSPIAGATDSFYVATQHGTYSVEITDGNGCSILSNGVLTSVNELNSAAGIMIYPNPASHSVTISWPFSINGNIDITVVNVLGEKVYDQQINSSGHVVITIKNLATGVYFVHILDSRGNYIGKFVKE